MHNYFAPRSVVEKLLLFTAHVGSPSDSVVEEWRDQGRNSNSPLGCPRSLRGLSALFRWTALHVSIWAERRSRWSDIELLAKWVS
jgi:hypothetical protein